MNSSQCLSRIIIHSSIKHEDLLLPEEYQARSKSSCLSMLKRDGRITLKERILDSQSNAWNSCFILILQFQKDLIGATTVSSG
jgi:hypothetical protein